MSAESQPRATAALRDASWHDHPGWGSKYHIVIERGHITGGATIAACSPDKPGHRRARMLLADFTERPADQVPSYSRCGRPGCRQRWAAVEEPDQPGAAMSRRLSDPCGTVNP